MRVLVAGEFSGIVREAFRRRGHYAKSCDYRPTEQPGPHHQGSWFDMDLLKEGWDLMIAHPDCTFLVVSGARWMSIEWREEAQLAALHTVKALMKFPIDQIAIENPVGKLSSLWRGPDQIIQPYQFGDPYKKTTCLWLKNLPPLVPTNDLGDGEQACWKEAPGPERKKNRARTYPGIADAMAEQWGGSMKKQFPCFVCERLFSELEQAEVCERSHRREECPICDGDGFSPAGGGNCSRCSGSGKALVGVFNSPSNKHLRSTR